MLTSVPNAMNANKNEHYMKNSYHAPFFYFYLLLMPMFYQTFSSAHSTLIQNARSHPNTHAAHALLIADCLKRPLLYPHRPLILIPAHRRNAALNISIPARIAFIAFTYEKSQFTSVPMSKLFLRCGEYDGLDAPGARWPHRCVYVTSALIITLVRLSADEKCMPVASAEFLLHALTPAQPYHLASALLLSTRRSTASQLFAQRAGFFH